MIYGAHVLLFSKDPESDRAFMRDVLRFRGVDAGEGWLIFALPPAEVGVHPIEDGSPLPGGEVPMLGAHLWLMCDDLPAVIAMLETRKVRCTPIQEEPWGKHATIELPSGGHIGLYEPSHPTALNLDTA